MNARLTVSRSLLLINKFRGNKAAIIRDCRGCGVGGQRDPGDPSDREDPGERGGAEDLGGSGDLEGALERPG